MNGPTIGRELGGVVGGALDAESRQWLEPLTSEEQADRRRHSRVNVSWPVIVTVNSHVLNTEAVNVSVRGAKVRSNEVLGAGTLARLYFRLPADRTLDLSAIVWRADPDGLAFFFIDDIPVDLERYSESAA